MELLGLFSQKSFDLFFNFKSVSFNDLQVFGPIRLVLSQQIFEVSEIKLQTPEVFFLATRQESMGVFLSKDVRTDLRASFLQMLKCLLQAAVNLTLDCCYALKLVLGFANLFIRQLFGLFKNLSILRLTHVRYFSLDVCLLRLDHRFFNY